ncbi:cyanophycinase [Cytophagaceae bacterium AH-315-L13]|nr:cyanophycinase [Cytophagaceae bacterium AH-315-L13]
MHPKGKLVIIGGNVDKGTLSDPTYSQITNLNFFELGILKRILAESPKKEKSTIEIVTTASVIPEQVGEEYILAFSQLNAADVHIMNIQARETANSKRIVDRVEKADIIWFTGGNQLRLTSILGGTGFIETLQRRYNDDKGLLIAGTSAGAAASSDNMIYQGSSKESLLKGSVQITGGFGFIKNVIVDTHFVKRGRIGRLIQACATNPSMLGIGLGEDTGLLITKGTKMEAIGSGLVILVDGKQIKNTNLTEIPIGSPVSIENVLVHVMSLYDTYDLDTDEMVINIE